MNNERGRLTLPAVAFVALGMILQGCSSGSGGSGVGSKSGIAPTARAQVLNGGVANTFREGSEVLLSGKDSEDGDGPLLDWSWEQTAGPTVRLVERSSVAVSFTTPRVAAETTLAFELTVADSSRDTGSTSVEVTVVPARDADKFLSLDLRGAALGTFDDFQIVAALAEGASTDSMPKPFTLSAVAYLVYPPRSNPSIDCRTDTSAFATGIPASTANGCVVELLENLTPFALPGGGTGIEGEWPANVPTVVRPDGATADRIASEWWNPHFTLRVPRLDVDDFNQQFVESGERGRILDQFNTPKSRIFFVFELAAPQNQQDATIIVNDLESTPIVVPSQVTPKTAQAQGKVVANDGVGLPTVSVVPQEIVLGAITGRESALTSQVYYRTVDPTGTRESLNDWLQQAGFTDDAGKLLPEAAAGDGEFAHALYLNNYDLGFGRDMYTRTDEFGNVYSFVVNYGTLEAAIRGNDPVVTVVMEYSPLADPADPTEKFVKFFTYVDDGSGDSRRVTSMNFDGRGERYTPGNCIACHGGAKPPGVSELTFDSTCGDRSDAMCYAWPMTNRDSADIADGNLGATFLPWDLDSFLFADTDPAITGAPARFDGVSLFDRLARDHGDYSRAVQEAQLKKLNQAAYATYCDAAQDPDCPSDSARRLVEHWYGGMDQNGTLLGEYDDSGAPPGWQNDEVVPTPTEADPGATMRNPDSSEDLYLTVYAKHCRMCHTNIAEEALRFDDYQKFVAQEALIERAVFEQGIMPAARLTADRFWTSFADGSDHVAARLAQEFAFEPAQGSLGPTPRALITGNVANVKRDDPVRLSGAASSFAESFGWNVLYAPPAELAGNPDVAGFQPTLVGGAGSELSFAAAKPGTYTVELLINDDGGSGIPAEPYLFEVENFTPKPIDLELLVAEGGVRSLSVLDQLNLLCSEAGCPDVFGDSPFTISVDVGAWDASDGELTLTDPATGTITLAANQPGPTTASIPFSIVDADSETASAAIDVTIQALSNPVANDDQQVMGAQSTVTSAMTAPPPREVTIAVLSNDEGEPAALPLHINSFSQPSNGVVTQSGDDLVYRPDLGFIGVDTFTYNVGDANPTGARFSANATAQVSVNRTVAFSQVVAAIESSNCFSCHGELPAAPNWHDYDLVKANVSSPPSALSSRILTFPVTHSTASGASPQGHWNRESQHFRTVWRWIEEGALP